VKLPGGGWGPAGAGREALTPPAAADAAKNGPEAAKAASEAEMLSQLLDALLAEAPDEFEAVRQTPFGVHPFEDINYRFYLLGPARESYLGLRYTRYGYPGQNRGCVDLVTREPFDYTNYYDVVFDPLGGTTTLVPKAFPGGTGGSPLPPLGAVWIQDVPAYNAAAGRFGWTTIPAVGVKSAIRLAE
jgi:hypothetical protein